MGRLQAVFGDDKKEMKPNKYEIGLILCIVVGAILRFWNIGFQIPNGDELFAMNFSRPELSFVGVFINALSSDFTPPVYYLLAHLSVLIFGFTIEAARYPSAVCGVLTIPVIYYAGKEYRSELMGLCLAGLLSIFYSAIFYSRYARAYSTEMFLFTISLYFFIKTLNGDRKSELWFGVFALLSLWTHLYSFIPIGIMILYLLYKQRCYWGTVILIPGSIPLLIYAKYIFSARVVSEGVNTYGASLQEIIFLSPFYLLCFSTVIIFPIIVYSFWKNRTDPIIRFIAITSIISYLSIIAISFKTPIMIHYTIFLIPLLLIAFVLPFYIAYEKRNFYFYHFLILLVIVLLELQQIWNTYTIMHWV
jgi:uncharacterized membrane protein